MRVLPIITFTIPSTVTAFFTSSTITTTIPTTRTTTSTTTSTTTTNSNNKLHTSTTQLNERINLHEQAPRNMESFDEWATTCGVQRFDGFQLYTDDGLDYSVGTIQDLSANECIVAIPENMILTCTKAEEELVSISNGGVDDAVQSLQQLGRTVTIPQFYLFLKILLEYQRGSDSPYYSYLDSLPRLYYTAVSMTEFCFKCLPPLVSYLSRAECAKFEDYVQVLHKYVDIIDPDIMRDYNVLKWAFNVVYTRSIGQGSGPYAIIPMADMFNHATETQVELQFDSDGNCLVMTQQDNNIPANSELCISYGDPTNPSKFFARYGFLDETSPATFCKIMDIKSSPQVLDLGYEWSRMLFYKDTGEVSEEVWDVILYDKVLKNKAELQQEFYQAHMNGDWNTKQAIHDEFALETMSFVKRHVDEFIQDLELLNEKATMKSVEDHPRLPLILHHNEFVKKTFYNVKKRLDPMVKVVFDERVEKKKREQEYR